MAEEANVNPESEKIDSTKTEEATASEGTLEAEINKLTESKEKIAEETVKETVPLSVFLDLKKDLKELKHDLKEAKTSQKSNVLMEGLSDLSEKYPDVNQEFLADLLSSATSKAKEEALKEIETKYSPIIEKQKFKEEKENFDKAFDSVYNKALKDNPDLPENIDKELIKTLVLTPKYKNVKISDILTQIYPNGKQGKSASENETATSTGDIETITSFDKITTDQRKAIMADDKARQKYFDWLDTQTGR